MLTRRTILLTAACSIAVCLTASRFAKAGPAAADDASALAFVTAIYDSYKSPDSDGVRIDSGRKLRRYFEPVLAAAMDKDQEIAARHHDEGTLGSDPFIDAQDWDLKQVAIAIKDTAPGKANATITFTNFGKPVTIVFDLVAIKNEWRIYDITWSHDGKPATLRGLFGLKRPG
jgi:uncharacterized protein DUF3828